jgi:glycerol-3-phosphate dehydrogenase
VNRDLQRLETETFDLAIIGGGVHGLAIARDAAQRGLSVALMEKGDLAAATSGNSLKIVHGGLRYIQHADLRRMRESIRERRSLLAIAPHLVRPLPCLMPTTGHGMRGPWVMRAALAVNDLLSLDRNASADPARRLPRSRVLSRRACREICPDGLPEQFNGGALWHDAQMIDSDRLGISLARAACEEGAALANYVAARGLLMVANRVAGVMAEDLVTGSRLTVRARLTVNAAGPWMDEVLSLPGGPRPQRGQPLSIAMNLVLRRPLVSACALALSSPVLSRDPHVKLGGDSRLIFLTPWRQGCIVGTTHLPYKGPADSLVIDVRPVETFLEEINRAYPSAGLTLDDVRLVHSGLLPAVSSPAADAVVLEKHYRLVDHARENGVPGLMSVLGVKWTTARDVAERAVNLAFRLLGHRPPPARTALVPLPGGDIEEWDSFLETAEAASRPEGLPPGLARRLATRYGTLWRRLRSHARDTPELLQEVASGAGVTGVEVLHAVREEMALTLADVVRRRTDLGTAGPPEPAALEATARLVAREMDWDDHRRERETQAVLEIYRLPAG